MKVRFCFGLLSSVGELNGNVFYAFETGGMFQDDTDYLSLESYIRGYDSIYFYENNLIKIKSLINGVKEKIIRYPGFQEIDIPLEVCGDIKRINYFDGMYISYIRQIASKKEMVIYDLKNDREVEIPVVGSRLAIDKETIIFRTNSDVASYNWMGEKIWSHPIGKVTSGADESIMVFGERIVFNAGYDENSGCNLTCLCKLKGDLIWEKGFENSLSNALVIGNKIYISQANKMSVLSADTAEQEITFTVDLPENETGTTLWTDGKLLYVLAATSNRLLCHFHDGAHTKTYGLPVYPDLKHGSLPFTFNNINYLGLRPALGVLAGVEGGLLTWTAEDVLAGRELELEERPFIISIVVSEDDGSQSYYLNIPCDNIHDVLRFGEIEAGKVAALRGKQMDDNSETRNKKFNGQIKLIIDPSIGEKNRPYLDMLVKRCIFFAEVMDIKSGNGKKPISVSWAFSDEI